MAFRGKKKQSTLFMITVVAFAALLAVFLLAREQPIVTGAEPVDAVLAWLHEGGESTLDAVSEDGDSSSGVFAGEVAEDAKLRVHMIDVGQGDSILIQGPEATVLIDGGEEAGRKALLAYLKEQGVKRIDLLVNTHPHSDHMGSFGYIVKNMDVGAVWMTRFPEDQTPTISAYSYFLRMVKEKGLGVAIPKPGEGFDLGGGAELTVIGPVKMYDSLNNNSLVCRLTYGDNSFLLTGDMEAEAEADLMLSGADLKADVLKAGHHGSSTSCTPAFVAMVRPRAVTVSCGAGNDYGHPHRETVALFRMLNVPIYRTDLNGTIVFVCDGEHMKVVTER